MNVCTTANPASNCGITNVIKSVYGCFFSKTNTRVATGLKLAEILEKSETVKKNAKPTPIAIYFGWLIDV